MRLGDAAALWLAGALAVAGCATTTRPAELVSAHDAYAHAAGGPAVTLAPVDLEAARVALAKADHAYESDDVTTARDLAYVAERKAQLAEARATEVKDLEGSAPSAALTP
jgi:hypothetical protein